MLHLRGATRARSAQGALISDSPERNRARGSVPTGGVVHRPGPEVEQADQARVEPAEVRPSVEIPRSGRASEREATVEVAASTSHSRNQPTAAEVRRRVKQGLIVLLSVVIGVGAAVLAVHLGGRWGGLALMVVILAALLLQPSPPYPPE